ncbi:MAG: hypothetical protein ACRDRB_04135 [Pseudonocardiaceae bacterium]
MKDPAAGDPDDDVVYRQRMARVAQDDAKETFKIEKVTVEYGEPDKGKPSMTTITLRYALDSPFVFAAIKDNPDWVNRARDLWYAVSRDAIEKFFALKGVQTKMAAKPEDSNRYNLMAEAGAPIEMAEETMAFLQEREAKNARIRAGSTEYPENFRRAGG